ncbi:hypothetical protein ACFLZF_00020 [Nanoarchaeota archaeon]
MNKKAVSIMIGYILLITGAIVMSAFVYQWLKTYIPQDAIECNDGISMTAISSKCIKNSLGGYDLEFVFKNNGRFTIDGYFIRATTNETQELATLDISKNLTSGGKIARNAINLMEQDVYFFTPGKEVMQTFRISDEIYSLEILPFENIVIKNKKRLASCTKAQFKEVVYCTEPEEEEEPECEVDDDCSGDEICSNQECTLCGNGVWFDDNEECDDGNNQNGDGCSSECEKEDGYWCKDEPSICTLN